MRKRIEKLKLKKGDIVKAELAGVPLKHICIILEDNPTNGHIKCIPVCNITGSKPDSDDYFIDLSKYDLPEKWFDKKKTNSWLRCNEIDCLYKHSLSEEDVVGNILESFPELWSEVCEMVFNCPISARLEVACDCEFDIIKKKISLGKREANSDCGCD